MRALWIGATFCALASAGILCAANSVTVVTGEGDEAGGDYNPAAGSVLIEGRAVPLNSLAQVNFAAPAHAPVRTQPLLKFSNGDVLAQIVIAAWKDTSLSIKSETLVIQGTLNVPTASVDALVFYAAGKKMPAELDAFLAGKAPTEDLVLTVKGEQSNGFVEKADAASVTLNSGGQSRTYGTADLAALRFAALQKPDAAKPTARVTLLDGSRLSVEQEAFAKDKGLAATFLGQRIELPIASLARIEALGAQLAYLSDWTPTDVSEPALVAGEPSVFTWRKDRSVVNGPVKIGERAYERGLGVHSASRLSFDLRGEYAKFIADVGLDASAPPKAGCAWKVLLDGKEAAQGEALSGAGARTVRLDLTNVKKLELVCDDLPGGDGFGARLNFGMTRLVKRQ